MGIASKTVALTLFLFSSVVVAQPHATAPVSISSEEAVRLAQRAVMNGAEQGYKVSASVVDAQGNLLATVKGDGAFLHTPKVTFKKAFTAVTTGMPTSELIESFKAEGGFGAMNRFFVANLDQSDNIVLLGGGVLLRRDGGVVGAIGVGGAPGGHLDDQIAESAIESVGWGK